MTDAIETVAADLNLTVNPINDAPDRICLSRRKMVKRLRLPGLLCCTKQPDVEGDELSVVNVTSKQSDTAKAHHGTKQTAHTYIDARVASHVDLASMK
ncbi:cadherin-like domain-containing protein [Vibrio chagasii]|nr:cadherin-like domain-containing protein [Vibrio chagasii]